jgi:hypothetical protein
MYDSPVFPIPAFCRSVLRDYLTRDCSQESTKGREWKNPDLLLFSIQIHKEENILTVIFDTKRNMWTAWSHSNQGNFSWLSPDQLHRTEPRDHDLIAIAYISVIQFLRRNLLFQKDGSLIRQGRSDGWNPAS